MQQPCHCLVASHGGPKGTNSSWGTDAWANYAPPCPPHVHGKLYLQGGPGGERLPLPPPTLLGGAKGAKGWLSTRQLAHAEQQETRSSSGLQRLVL